MSFTLVFIALYLGAIVFITFLSARKETREDYLLSGRNLSWLGLSTSMSAGWIGGTMMVFISSIAYGGTAIMVAFTISTFFSLLFMAFYAGRIRDMGYRHNTYTMPGFLEKAFGKPTQILIALLTGCIYLTFVAMELIVGGTLLSLLTDWSYEFSVSLLAVFVAGYLMIGGFSAIVKTDFLQFALILFLGLLFIFFADYSGITQSPTAFIVNDTMQLPLSALIATIIIALPAQIMPADLWQRMFAARSARDAAVGVSAFVVIISAFFLLMTVLAVLVGFKDPDLDDTEVFIEALNFFLQPWALPFAFVAFLAVLMSSLDNMMFVTGQSFVDDTAARIFPSLESKPRLAARVGIFLTAMAAAIIALLQIDLEALIYLVLYFYTCMMSGFYMVLMKKHPSGTGVFIAILAAATLNTGLFFSGFLTDWISICIMVAAMLFPFIFDKIWNL